MAEQRFKDNNKNFPILFENTCLLVYTNGSGEVFVENKESGATLRIGPDFDSLIATAHDGVLSPWSEIHLEGFKLAPRK